MTLMAANSTLLCIHRDPAQLSLLEQHGYDLVTATSGSEGLRLFMSRPVDAIVLDYQLGLLDGGVVASVIKQVKPEVPIVMLAEHIDLPEDALKSVDALVVKSGGPHFLLTTVRSVLSGNPARHHKEKLTAQGRSRPRPPGQSREEPERHQSARAPCSAGEKDAPFSPKVWKNILNGTFQF